jgi:hypothetical protein
MLVSQPRTEGVQSSLEMCRGVGSVLRVGVSVSVGRNDHPEILCPNRLAVPPEPPTPLGRMIG